MATNIDDLRTGEFDTQSCGVLHYVTRSILSYPMATSTSCKSNQRVDPRYEDVIN